MDSFPNQKTNNPGESSKFPKHYYWKDFIGGINGRERFCLLRWLTVFVFVFCSTYLQWSRY